MKYRLHAKPLLLLFVVVFATLAINWPDPSAEALAPDVINDEWEALGPEGGTLQALALSPAFGDDGNVYVGGEEGGVFLSTDSGDSWEQANQGLTDDSIGALAISPAFQPTKPYS